MKIKNKYTNQSSREASSKSRIFLISLEYVCIYLCMYLFIYLCPTSGPKENGYRPENWHINSQWPYLKTVFFFFEKITMKAACLEKLPCHVDFPHISSIALFSIPLIRRHNPKLNKQLFQKGRLLTLQFSA